MRRAWLAAGYAAAWAVACSTTNNVTNVTNVVDDAGSSDGAARVGEAPTEAGDHPNPDVVVDDAGSDAGEDSGTTVCTGGNAPASVVSDDCYAANPCPFDYCGPTGFVYSCNSLSTERPPIDGCRKSDKGLHCCLPQCVPFKSAEPYGCANPYSCPKAPDGGPAIPIPAGCTPKKDGASSQYWPNDGYVVCCPL